MKTLRHLIEYGLARFILFIFDTLPYGIACAFARGSANLWWLVDRKRRIIARDNILRSGIETDPKQALVLAKRATQHMALVVVESLRSTQFLGDETWRDHVELDIKPDVLEALENPETGLIMVSGHFGNWEIAAHLLSRYKPVAGITRKMNNPRMEKLIQSRKSRYRFRPIPKYGNNPGRFIDVLKNNEILALLFDQHAGNYGMMID
ncbi:MAG: hypothetical protein O7C75_06650, partial [Verrucomicrobia bacterium]|nr:hypothetical protein [Verrucomicrobiota bacterium]